MGSGVAVDSTVGVGVGLAVGAGMGAGAVGDVTATWASSLASLVGICEQGNIVC